MKNEKKLSLIVFLLVVIIGLQSYYMFGKKEAVTNTQNPVVLSNIKAVFDKNPFEQMQKMQKEMDKIFNNMSSNFSAMPEFEQFFNDVNIFPSLNIEDKKDSYVISLNIPGSDKNSIKINVENSILSVEAQTKKLNDKKSSNFLQKEIYEGSFVRSITIPKDASADKLSSDYKNGVLTITLPKKS
jgi:HSP20 family protein